MKIGIQMVRGVVLTNLAFVGLVQAQSNADTTIIATELGCERCRIDIQWQVDLEGPEPPGVLDFPSAIATWQGGFVLAFHTARSEVHLYSGEGRHSRSYGREGGGPGEYVWITALLSQPQEELDIFDARGPRQTRLNREGDVIFTRNIDSRRVVDVLAHPDGGLIVNSVFRTPEAAGFPLVHLDPEGHVARAIRPDELLRDDLTLYLWRNLAPSETRHGYWAAHNRQYVVDFYPFDGDLRHRLVRVAEWFPPRITRNEVTPEFGPPPSLRAVSEDANGLLWTAVIVPQPNWRDGVREARRSEGGYLTHAVDTYSQVWDTVVEVIDPAEGTVLARWQLDELALDYVDAGQLALWYDDPETGAVYVKIVGLTLNATDQTSKRGTP